MVHKYKLYQLHTLFNEVSQTRVTRANCSYISLTAVN